jgi:GT2 family glycosyltransferase
MTRPAVRGKFLFAGAEKLYVRGVTYGAFRPDEEKREYQNFDVIERDFAMMAAAGFNAVRIPHTMPPRRLLDIAHAHGLRVMVGLSAEQYAGYLADPEKAPDIDAIIRAKIAICKGHPALLCYALGNEISASMARWLGRRKVERYLERLYAIVKREDPASLVTYVNYPSTEYLQLPFLDFLAFNVYLESEPRLRAYLARLQNLAGDRPLLMSEMGLDSMRNGAETQARTLEGQIRTTFEEGCAGGFIFSWTDEWHRGGADVDDWAFGLTDADRRPKPALAAVTRAFASAPMTPAMSWPRISVIVCVYNGEQTIRDCCDGLLDLAYANYEVIVVDDGSTDGTAAIVEEYGFQLIRTPNRGLSEARNTGLAAATGEIVAYTDGDARPDPHWLTYLASAFMTSDHVGIGGWNIAPAGDGWVAECVANSPGGPVHVLLSDTIAEHIPGCSMAFRRSALQAIGGFDPQFRAAGDDVDVCWRLQERGGTLGFAHGAMVWHHNRNSIRTYWTQQQGYGRAEALLERKWPEKYNSAGHVTWGGRLYGRGLTVALGQSSRIYQGPWGSAPFQRLEANPAGFLEMLPLMPEWYLVIAILGALSLLGLEWPLLLWAIPLLAACTTASLAQAIVSGARARLSDERKSGVRGIALRGAVAFLHVLQPIARLAGRNRHGLTIWRRRGSGGLSLPIPRKYPLWVGRWQAADDRLRAIHAAIKRSGAVVMCGGDYARWDLQVRGGVFGHSRLQMAVEDSGSGTQVVRVRTWPVVRPRFWTSLAVLVTLPVAAAIDNAVIAPAVFVTLAVLVTARALIECAASSRALHNALDASGLLTAKTPATVLTHAHERKP